MIKPDDLEQGMRLSREIDSRILTYQSTLLRGDHNVTVYSNGSSLKLPNNDTYASAAIKEMALELLRLEIVARVQSITEMGVDGSDFIVPDRRDSEIRAIAVKLIAEEEA